MTTAAESTRCHRCRRLVRKQPVPWFGKVLGPSCAERYGLAPEKRARVRQPKRQGVEHQPVLDGLEEINEENGEPT